MKLLSVLFGCACAAAMLFAQTPPQSAEAKTQIIRSITFEHFGRISVQDILRTFKERDVKLAVEAPYEPRNLDFAKEVLTNILAENGKRGARVNAVVTSLASSAVSKKLVRKPLAPGSSEKPQGSTAASGEPVKITFTLVSN